MLKRLLIRWNGLWIRLWDLWMGRFLIFRMLGCLRLIGFFLLWLVSIWLLLVVFCWLCMMRWDFGFLFRLWWLVVFGLLMRLIMIPHYRDNHLRINRVCLLMLFLLSHLFHRLIMMVLRRWWRHNYRPIVLEKQLPYNFIRIKSIHSIHQIPIFKNFHFRKRMHSHLAAKPMILLIAIHLINRNGILILIPEIIDDVLEVLAVSAPWGEKL